MEKKSGNVCFGFLEKKYPLLFNFLFIFFLLNVSLVFTTCLFFTYIPKIYPWFMLCFARESANKLII